MSKKSSKSNDEQIWVEKYRPKRVSMMVGNEANRLGFLKWLSTWKRGGRPALLVGPPGVGKTTLVYAAADELGYTVVELNASDVRTKDKIESKLGPIRENTSLFGERLIILMDEVDGLYGRQDYGGMEGIMGMATNSAPVPLVMTANSAEDERIRKAGSKSEVFHFGRVTPRLIELYLREITRREGLKIDDSILKGISERSDGDMRAAINDLMTAPVARGRTAEVPSVQRVRDRTMTLRESVESVFAAESAEQAILSLRLAHGLPQDKLRGIFTSLVSSALDIETLATSLSALADADVILGRIRRSQEWSLLRYFDTLLATGLFNALSEKKDDGTLEFRTDSLPWDVRIRIWNEGRYFRILGTSLGKIFSVSSRDFASLYLPYLALIASREKASINMLSRIGIEDSSVRVFKKEMARVEAKVKAKKGR